MAIDTSRDPARYDFNIVKGDPFDQTFIAPVDYPLSGMTECEISLYNQSSTLLKTFTIGSGITIISQTIILSMTEEETGEFKNDIIDYKCKFTIDGVKRTAFVGIIIPFVL